MSLKNNKYAAPGANDFFLCPDTGHNWAPRQIEVLTLKNKTIMAWIHRRDEADCLAVKLYPHSNKRNLFVIESSFKYYSKPCLLENADNEILLICSVSNGNRHEIHVYKLNDGDSCLIKTLSSSCEGIYNINAIFNADGDIDIVYSGVVKDKPGIQLFSQSCLGKKWQEEIKHKVPGESATRPLLVSDDNNTFVICDIYGNDGYNIYMKKLYSDNWIKVTNSSQDSWEMFPAVAKNSKGEIFFSWLKQDFVEKDSIAGISQYAKVGKFKDGQVQILKSEKNNKNIASLNMGLLPVKRYFGYDGLRKYPRLAVVDNSIWLIWEQQKDEKEIWSNLNNGYLFGKELKNDKWGPRKILFDKGCCFAFDSRARYTDNLFSVAVKSEHEKDGSDFFINAINLRNTEEKSYPDSLWSEWGKSKYPYCLKNNNRLSVKAGNDELHLYWGDLHCHSVFSPDAEGECDELFHFAKEKAEIDFACLSDNDFYPNKTLLDSEISYISKAADALSADGEFIGLAGYEWTFHRPDKDRRFNHRIVIFPPGKFEAARRNESSGQTPEAFKEYLANSGFLCFPHHADWKLHDIDNEFGVEVTSAWGVYVKDSERVFQQLNTGKIFAFLGNSDSHRFMPGLSGALTGTYADNLSWDALKKSFIKRRTFATTGNKTAIALWVNEGFMGDIIKPRNEQHIRWEVKPENQLEQLDIIRNGEIIYSTDRLSGNFIDKDVPEGNSWYLVHAKEKGNYIPHPHNVAVAKGNYAWTTPIWLIS